MLGFLRITTGRHILAQPMPYAEACDVVAGWFRQPCVRTVDPLPGHWQLMRSLLDAVGNAGGLTTDAHLAALALQHGCELCSTDADFSRFPGLSWSNPAS